MLLPTSQQNSHYNEGCYTDVCCMLCAELQARFSNLFYDEQAIPLDVDQVIQMNVNMDQKQQLFLILKVEARLPCWAH